VSALLFHKVNSPPIPDPHRQVTLQCLGAAFAVAAPSVPAWNDGYAGGNIGGLLEAVLQPTKGFGKFLTVLLSLSVSGNIAPTLYSASFNIQILIPPLVIVPRYIFSIVATAMYSLSIYLLYSFLMCFSFFSLIPVAILGAHRFYAALLNFLGLISYYGSAYGAIVLVEHYVFRHNDATAYDVSHWNMPKRLPSGIAAVGAGLCSFALVVPCMAQAWFVGPIAKTTGDIGFEVAFVLSAVLYVPFRAFELRIQRSR